MLGAGLPQDVCQRCVHEVARARRPQATCDNLVRPVRKDLQVEVKSAVPQEEELQNQTHQAESQGLIYLFIYLFIEGL